MAGTDRVSGTDRMLRSVVTIEVEVVPVPGFVAGVRGLSGENGEDGIARWEDLKGAG